MQMQRRICYCNRGDCGWLREEAGVSRLVNDETKRSWVAFHLQGGVVLSPFGHKYSYGLAAYHISARDQGTCRLVLASDDHGASRVVLRARAEQSGQLLKMTSSLPIPCHTLNVEENRIAPHQSLVASYKRHLCGRQASNARVAAARDRHPPACRPISTTTLRSNNTPPARPLTSANPRCPRYPRYTLPSNIMSTSHSTPHRPVARVHHRRKMLYRH